MPAESRNTAPAFPAPTDDAEAQAGALARPGASDTGSVATDELAPVEPAGLTAVDRRRPVVPAAPAQPAAPARKRMVLIASVLAVILAAALAIVLALVGTGGARTPTFRSGELVLRPGSRWRRSDISVPGLALIAPVAISAGGTGVEAGSVAEPAALPGSPPATLTAAYGPPAQARLIALPLGQAKSYTWPRTPHGALSVLMIATERGESAIACTTVAAAASAATERACRAVRETARVTGAQVEYPGADPRVTSALSRALASRARAIAAAAGGARSAPLPSRAGALKTLATSDERAAQAVRGISAPPHDASSIAALGDELARQEALMRRMVAAALGDDRSLYDSFRERLTSTPVTAARAGLSAVGFTGLPLPALSLAAAPAPRRTRHRSAAHVAPAPSSTPQPVATAPVASPPSPTPTPAPTPPPRPREKVEVITSKEE